MRLIKCYDKEGKLISWLEYLSIVVDDPSYRRVDETTLPDGRWVSTVWLGIDHGFGDGPPLIFETLVFESESELVELDHERYSTLAGAIIGHQIMVSKWLFREIRLDLKGAVNG